LVSINLHDVASLRWKCCWCPDSNQTKRQ